MKIYINSANENWIVDRFREEWYSNNNTISTKSIYFSDIVWIISPWTWEKLNKKILKKKKVVCSIYHIDEEKFNEKEKNVFLKRDKFVDQYHVISNNTKSQIAKLTNKPITSIPFWINTEIFYPLKDKTSVRKKYDFNEDDFIIGSFQRDTEGKDLKSPKLSKGPDRLIKIIEHLQSTNSNLKVLLAGKRRDFLINELEKLNISYLYNEMVNFETLNELYNCLDLYVVSSRFEGGPQAIMESSITKTPIISTNVGVAPEILSNESIFDMNNFESAKPNVQHAYTQAKNYIIPQGFVEFKNLFNRCYED